ncbi:MAG: hypothetical protein LAT68_12590 [Cyclobacteriaceae bacterium]|nr:hypothetical protein [Cyclobacteriaceae bacterium]
MTLRRIICTSLFFITIAQKDSCSGSGCSGVRFATVPSLLIDESFFQSSFITQGDTFFLSYKQGSPPASLRLPPLPSLARELA